MKLYLVRHGASTGNTPGNLLGHGPHPLTPLGVAQAEAAAARLSALGPMPVYCSDLVRAHQTAERIAAVWGVQPPAVHDDERLRELHLGEYEGRSWADFLADAELNAAMTAEPFHTVLPDGESVAQMQTRVLAATSWLGTVTAARPRSAKKRAPFRAALSCAASRRRRHAWSPTRGLFAPS